MNGYRLFVFDRDGRLIGPAVVVPATNDDEAIARAEVHTWTVCSRTLGCKLPADRQISRGVF
jgi:hypothetical protein